MLKKMAWLLGFATLVFLTQNGIHWVSLHQPLAVAPLILFVHPVISFAFGYYVPNTLRFPALLVCIGSFLLFCFQSINIGSLVYTSYYCLLFWSGILLSKKFHKNK